MYEQLNDQRNKNSLLHSNTMNSALICGQRLVSDRQHFGLVHKHCTDHGDSCKKASGDEHEVQVQVQSWKKEKRNSNLTSNMAAALEGKHSLLSYLG